MVTCYETNENGTIVKLEDDACAAVEGLKKPESEETCVVGTDCSVYDWISTPWSGCAAEEGSPSVCGAGMFKNKGNGNRYNFEKIVHPTLSFVDLFVKM